MLPMNGISKHSISPKKCTYLICEFAWTAFFIIFLQVGLGMSVLARAHARIRWKLWKKSTFRPSSTRFHHLNIFIWHTRQIGDALFSFRFYENNGEEEEEDVLSLCSWHLTARRVGKLKKNVSKNLPETKHFRRSIIYYFMNALDAAYENQWHKWCPAWSYWIESEMRNGFKLEKLERNLSSSPDKRSFDDNFVGKSFQRITSELNNLHSTEELSIIIL